MECVNNKPSIEQPQTLLNFSARKKLPVILQAEAAECGLACLAMILGYHGFETDLVTMRQEHAVSLHGSTLKQVMDLAARYCLSPRALRLEPQSLSNLNTPCILHWELNHFVVLKKVAGKKVIIHDPAVGEIKLDFDVVNKLFTGVALELTPTSNFKVAKSKINLKLNQFWHRIVGLKRSLVQVFLLSLMLQIFALASPYFMQTVVDDVLLRKDGNLLLVLAFGFSLLLIIDTVVSSIRQIVIIKLSQSLNMQMAANVFRHLIHLPVDYFVKRHVGDIVSRFGSLTSIREMLTTGLISALLDGLLAAVTLIAMFMYSAKLSLIVLAIVFLYAMIRIAFYRPFRQLSEEQIVVSAKENSHFMESIRAIQTIKLFQKEVDRQSAWQNKMADVINKNIKIANWQVSYDAINKFLFGVENILVIYFAATQVMGSLMTVGMLYAFMSYKGQFVSAIGGLISKAIEFKMLGLHLNRLSDITATNPEIEQNYQNLNKIDISGCIEAKQLAYRYAESEPDVFCDLDLKINAGESVVFIGASGCGKSTLLKCLMGLIKPSQGEILVDGKPLKSLANYRNQIAAVMQDDQLLSGSILDNVTCFDSQVDMQKAVACLQFACLWEEVSHMPMQLNTLVGDMGTSLSGGQKQRVILARALYKQPKILFMDEATSHLDEVNERQINENIKQLGVTKIVVAHRQETIAYADRVIDLNKIKTSGKET
ncbi:putative toxin secretion ABC transporter ATP-binding subunit/permease [Catenovulum agarivorans DS-2]|uniref:Putative toxin secretion ABC transporter ATP-binding subunit/permease n=1 Tax=Catenovulum agarivorans DS-2 TaxID=1328313 RepID=W7QVI5_9ALTE|nr:peptidase domain-containing ABC transporter [Catenovulum agarivorans]EWH09295.1 putative toxin secretion ABC transporter ATP-binding subunit/permease [Catenovulum agarivorans DS-2]